MPEAVCFHVLAEDAPVAFGTRRRDGEAVSESPKERLLGEIVGTQVAGEDQHLLEGYLILLSGVQRQVVNSILERDDPAVEKIAWVHPLPPEIIDQKCPAIGLQLEWGLVELDGLIVTEVHTLDSQFSTNDHEGSMDLDPALVVGDSRLLDRRVVVRVEDVDDVAVHLDGPRNPDLATERQVKSPGDGCLAVAGRAAYEEAATGTGHDAEHLKGS